MKNKIVKDTLALTVITLGSGLLLGLVNDITAGPIASQQAKEKEEAYMAVFADAASFESVTSGEDTDLESYLDYYSATLYIGNSQFYSFSTTLWRRAGEGETGKWHWEFSDATDTLGRNKVSNYSVNTYMCPRVAEDQYLQVFLNNK